MAAHPNAAFSAALVAALADLGLEHVCLSPGSRSAPLAVAFAEHDGIRTWVHLDERSAGFFAIGLARRTGRPVALLCTSGTAAAQYFPAVTEAAASRVPLLVLTADRPPELRDVGAPQAIDQIKLYGDAVKWFHHGAPPDDTAVAHAPHLAAHAWGAACDLPAGPVHLNLPFRGPLAAGEPAVVPRQSAPEVRFATAHPHAADIATVMTELNGRRPLFVVGSAGGAAARAIHELAVALEAPVFADPQSGLRAGAHEAVIVPADLLAAAGALDRLTPDVVVRWGSLPTSKAQWRWLEDHSHVPQILVDPGGHRDPLGSSRLVLRTGLEETVHALSSASPAAQPWLAAWHRVAKAAEDVIAAVLDDQPFPNEPAIARTVFAAAPARSALFCASSMPIRDVDAFAASRIGGLEVYANRGANGIDGSIATAAGIAAGGTTTTALVGDVAALHDIGSLATVQRLGLPVKIVVVHNDGGGIFQLLPHADPALLDPAIYERVFATPHGTDFVAAARAFGMAATPVTSKAELFAAVADDGRTPALLQLHTDRGRIAGLRRDLIAEIAGTLPAT